MFKGLRESISSIFNKKSILETFKIISQLFKVLQTIVIKGEENITIFRF